MNDLFNITCETCIFFRVSAGKDGQCWRYPPTALPMLTQPEGRIQVGDKAPQGIAVAAIRPPVALDTLACGEYDDGADDGAETASGTD